MISPNGLPIVYVGRPSYYGNPYEVGKLSEDSKYPVTIEQAIGFYKLYILNKHRIVLNEIKRELKGKNLACWCKLNKPCHADILLKIANE